MNTRTAPCGPALWIGVAAVALVPLAHLDGIDRFALLPQVLALQAVVLAGMGVWIWKGEGNWRPSTLAVLAVASLLADAVSVTAALNRTASLLPIATHTALIFLFLVLLNGLEPAGFRRVLKAAALTAAIVSALGAAQFLGWGRGWVPTAGLPSSTLGHRNIAAAYLVGVLPLTFWAWAESKRPWEMALWGAALGLEGAFLLATRSRGAWVGLGFSVAVIAAMAAFWQMRGLAAACRRISVFRALSLSLAILLVVGAAVLPAEVEKGEGEAMWEGKRSMGTALASVLKEGGDRGRLTLWRRTLEMIADRPIIGVGVGNWRLAYPAYAQGDLVDPRMMPHRPHNDFLWIWAETGTVGLGLYLALLWIAARTAIRQFRGGAHPLLSGALFCSLTAAVANSAFGFPMQFPAAWMPFYLALTGIGLQDRVRLRRSGIGGRALLWGGVALLAAGVWVSARQLGFDRHALPLRIAFAQSRWPDVIREADRALAWGAFDEEAFLMRGRAYASLGAPQQALVDFRQGLAVHPNSAGLWNGLGNALRQAGDRRGAHLAYRRALDVDPGSGAAYNNIGTLYAMAGATDSALAAYSQAVACQPDLAEAFVNLSILYRKMGDLTRSFDAAAQALERDPDGPEALNAAGGAYMAAGRYAAAAGMFSRALAADSTRVEIHYNLGRAYEHLRDPTAAAAAYGAILRHWRGGDTPYMDVVRRRLEALQAAEKTP